MVVDIALVVSFGLHALLLQQPYFTAHSCTYGLTKDVERDLGLPLTPLPDNLKAI